MFRSSWLTLLLASAGAAWGQQPAATPAADPAEAWCRCLFFAEAGRPSRECAILKRWTAPDGGRFYQLGDRDTGEIFVVRDDGRFAPRSGWLSGERVAAAEPTCGKRTGRAAAALQAAPANGPQETSRFPRLRALLPGRHLPGTPTPSPARGREVAGAPNSDPLMSRAELPHGEGLLATSWTGDQKPLEAPEAGRQGFRSWLPFRGPGRPSSPPQMGEVAEEGWAVRGHMKTALRSVSGGTKEAVSPGQAPQPVRVLPPAGRSPADGAVGASSAASPGAAIVHRPSPTAGAPPVPAVAAVDVPAAQVKIWPPAYVGQPPPLTGCPGN